MDLQLEKNELLDLGDDLRTVSVHCQAGCCWLTQAGDSRDHILHAGQSHTLSRRGKVLVMATAPTRLQLIGEPDQEKTTAARRLLWAQRLW